MDRRPPVLVLALALALLATCLPPRARAAGPPAPDSAAVPVPAASAMSSAGAYHLPTGRQRLVDWANNALGPFAVAGDLTSAGWEQWVADEPPEWSGDGRGFARRLGAAAATTALTETSFSLISALAGEDAHYYRCKRAGFGPRLAHALKMTLCARRADGSEAFSLVKTASPFVGPMVTRTTLYPDRYGAGDGALSGAYALLMNAGWNVAYEFVLKPKRW
jgi:hypothetical protein